jgi:hypothetical protein
MNVQHGNGQQYRHGHTTWMDIIDMDMQQGYGHTVQHGKWTFLIWTCTKDMDIYNGHEHAE